MTNNNQVNWDELPEDVEAVVTCEGGELLYLKRFDGCLFVKGGGAGPYVERDKGSLGGYMRKFGDQFHLRPKPTPEPPESTRVETSEVDTTTTPEFDWSSVEDDVEAVIVNEGVTKQHLKTVDGVLMFFNLSSNYRSWDTCFYKTLDEREATIKDFRGGNAKLLRRPPAITPPSENLTCKVEFYEGETLKPSTTPIEGNTYDIYEEAAINFKLDADMYGIFKGADSKPSISTILHEAQQSILKHHGVTGKVKFTVTCSE